MHSCYGFQAYSTCTVVYPLIKVPYTSSWKHQKLITIKFQGICATDYIISRTPTVLVCQALSVAITYSHLSSLKKMCDPLWPASRPDCTWSNLCGHCYPDIFNIHQIQYQEFSKPASRVYTKKSVKRSIPAYSVTPRPLPFRFAW